MQKIYIFGNEDVKHDSIAIKVANQLKPFFPNIEFVIHDPIIDFEADENDLVIIDAAMGIKKVTVLDNLDQLAKRSYSSLHDYDIAFNLKFLKKIGKISSVKIIALPMGIDLTQLTEEVKALLMSTQFQENL